MHYNILISFALLLLAAITLANPITAPQALEKKDLKQFQLKRGLPAPVRRSPQHAPSR